MLVYSWGQAPSSAELMAQKIAHQGQLCFYLRRSRRKYEEGSVVVLNYVRARLVHARSIPAQDPSCTVRQQEKKKNLNEPNTRVCLQISGE